MNCPQLDTGQFAILPALHNYVRLKNNPQGEDGSRWERGASFPIVLNTGSSSFNTLVFLCGEWVISSGNSAHT